MVIHPTKELRMVVLIVLALILVSSPRTADADVIMTLQATNGSLKQVQDSAFGSRVSGAGFELGFTPTIGFAVPAFSIPPLLLSAGQLFDQSGPLSLFAPLVTINGNRCCEMQGTLNISSIPSVAIPVSGAFTPTLSVTAPFTATGILSGTTTPSPNSNVLDQGPFGDYFFAGAGTMTSEFRNSCGSVTEPNCFFWNSSVLTFSAAASSTVPEPST
jgi:hypothetical protein